MVGHTWMIRGWWGRVMKNRRSRCDWRLITSFYGPFLESPRFLVLIWLMRKTLTLTGLSLSPSLSLSQPLLFSQTPQLTLMVDRIRIQTCTCRLWNHVSRSSHAHFKPTHPTVPTSPKWFKNPSTASNLIHKAKPGGGGSYEEWRWGSRVSGSV